MAYEPEIQFGNAQDDTRAGWFVGAFMSPEAGLRETEAVEVKWGVHRAGEERAEWVTGEIRHTLSVLVLGRFVIEFPDGEALLSQPGQFAQWGPGVDHRWRAIEDSTIVTVRTPSIRIY